MCSVDERGASQWGVAVSYDCDLAEPPPDGQGRAAFKASRVTRHAFIFVQSVYFDNLLIFL